MMRPLTSLGRGVLPWVLLFALLWTNSVLADTDRYWAAVESADLTKPELAVSLATNLARLNDPKATPALQKLLQDGPDRAKLLAAVALARLGRKDGAALLAKTLESADRTDASLAAASLALLGDEAGMEWIRVRFQRGRAEWAQPVCNAIVGFGLRDCAPLLVRTIQDRQALAEFRHQSLAALLRLGDERAYPFAEKLLRETRAPADLIVLLGATREPKVFPILEGAFKEWKDDAPQAFVQAFMELGDPRAIPLIRDATTAADPNAFTIATLALAALGDRDSLGKCADALEPGETSQAALAAQRALGMCPADRLPDKLRTLALSRNKAVQTLVAQCLMLRYDEASGRMLHQILGRMDRESQLAFVREIVRRPNGSGVEALAAGLEWAEGDLRADVAVAFRVAVKFRAESRRIESSGQLF